MTSIFEPFRWFYHEFGLVSIHETGRNAYFIILARACRMFAYATNSLILAIFMSAIKFSDHQIGIFMTLTLLGDVFLGTGLTLIADRVGRRKVLLGGSFLMILSGIIFAYFENFWILLIAAILGVISVTGGDFGPFRSVEESVLSQLTTPSTRSDVLSWYVTTSAVGSSIGSEVSGRMIHALQARQGWTTVDAYHALFWIYAVMGVVNAVLVLALSSDCELRSTEKIPYASVPQVDEEEARGTSSSQPPTASNRLSLPSQSKSKPKPKSRLTILNHLVQISPSTRSTMYKLWTLLALDSLADGMVPYSLTTYYMDLKFHPAAATLGDTMSVAYTLSAVFAVFAAPLARKTGLINTMVYTHVPSSAAVLLFPLPNRFWMTAGLLFLRAGLNNMDQAPRTAFIATVVKSDERTAVMGITGMARTLAAMCGPTVTGWLAGGDRFGLAFVVAGLCRLLYDFGLWALFVRMDVGEGRGGENGKGRADGDVAEDGRRSVELDSLAGSSDDEEGEAGEVVSSGALGVPSAPERARSRSPHRLSRET